MFGKGDFGRSRYTEDTYTMALWSAYVDWVRLGGLANTKFSGDTTVFCNECGGSAAHGKGEFVYHSGW